MKEMGQLLGVVPKDGGVHPDLGTANALLSFGNRTYLELIGPDPDGDSSHSFGRVFAALPGPDLLTFAVETSDLRRIEEIGRSLGLQSTGISNGSRKTQDGNLLQWELLIFQSGQFRGLVPFFIDWGGSTHPGESSAHGLRLGDVRITHPQNDQLSEIYKQIGLGLTVEQGDAPELLISIETDDDPTPLNAAALNERMACSKEKSDGREALQTRGNHLEIA